MIKAILTISLARFLSMVRAFVILPGACVYFLTPAFAGLVPFPLAANQEGIVSCAEDPAIQYNIYLPPGYSTNGPPLPILYTLNASGGGMVSTIYTTCSNLNIIAVGIINSSDSTPWTPILRDFYAVPRDIRRRVRFDPTAVFVGGFSGGGENSYVFSRFWPQQVSGVFTMAGWLGYLNWGASVTYYSTARVQTSLFVARASGTSDTGAAFYNPYDSNFLASCGATVHDWYFGGGHVPPPGIVQKACLQWLLSNRMPPGPNDEALAAAQAQTWRAEAAAGDTEEVLSNCIATMMNQPRSWHELEAQLVLDDLMTNYDSFRLLDVSNLMPASTSFVTNQYSSNLQAWSQNDYVSDLLYFYARGAAHNGDWARYHCALKLLTGIGGSCGDRAGDVCYLLTNFSYAAPLLQIYQQNSESSLVNISVSKDTPGLSYSLQSGTDVVNGTWQNRVPINSNDADAVWSATIDPDPGSPVEFYRVAITPNRVSFLPWPDNPPGQ
ncbi:MAG TPA: hypothetical protein VH280_03495 [Verrucomicrobiae bacterium]|nr:hypothetical protein [Verrucomicrobiae bacterium]